MKLLLLCMNFAPESTGIAPFTTALSTELARRGHQVTVATTFPHYPEWRTHDEYRGKWFLKETRANVLIHRTRVYLPKRAGTIERILYDTSLSIGLFFSGVRVREVDLILVVEPPIQASVTARVLAQMKRVPYAIWIQDLALEAAVSVGMLRASFAMRLANQLEAWAHAGAQKLIVIAQGFFENLRRKKMAASKLIYLPNWADVENFSNAPRDNSFRQQNGICEDARVVLHSGNMGVKQQLENVLEAAARLKQDHKICFLLVGDGSQKESLQEYAQRAGLSNVKFLSLQPQAQVSHMMAAADILLVNQHPDMIEAVIPSKLLTYMAAARPIVLAAHDESEAARQVRAAACGICVAPNDPDALAHAIVSLANDAETRAVLGARGRAFVEKNFARAALLDAFEKELCALVE